MTTNNNVIKMTDLDLSDKKVLIRADLNVPLEDGKVVSDQRIVAALQTIRLAISGGGRVILLSHLGRPEEGIISEKYSLAPIALYLSTLLDAKVRFIRDWLDGVEVAQGEVVLCENVRFNVGEINNSRELSKRMAVLADIFVMDAFGAAHRAQASTEGVARYAPIACGGSLLIKELDALSRSLRAPKRPLVAIVGGSKVSTKLMVLDSLSSVVDHLILGGGIVNTFIAAAGHKIGKSMHEGELVPKARRLLTEAEKRNTNIPLPSDVIVAKTCTASAETAVKTLNEISDDDLILDIGPKTALNFADMIKAAGTVVWNGPVGVFELPPFSGGTRELAVAVGESQAFSIVGGGDTLAAVEAFNVTDKISYLSTGGGAFLEYLEGRTLPAVAILEERAIS